MVGPLVALPKLQARSTPLKPPFSCDPGIESEPIRCLILPYKRRVDRRINLELISHPKRSRPADRSEGVPETEYTPGMDHQEHPREIRRKRRRLRSSSRFLSRLRLWYMASSIRYIVRKAKAVYDELCSDAYEDSRWPPGEAVMSVDPYFSLPVEPPSTSSVSA